MVRFSKGRATALAKAMFPTIQNPDIFVWISNSFDKMAQFERILDPIRNPDHLQTNLFFDKDGFHLNTRRPSTRNVLICTNILPVFMII